MATEHDDSQGSILREVRQRLESLRRSGLDRLAIDIGSFEAREAVPESPAEVVEAPPPAPVVQKPIVAKPAPSPIPTASLFDSDAIAEPVIPASDRPVRLAALAARVAECQRCPVLVASRTQTVFGVGSPTARLMFVGEAPGADEDRMGIPFVGRAGQLLTDMITKGMGMNRDDVYIANVVKSRPPENRNPLPDEIAHCLPFLEEQIAIIRPEYLCLLGKVAASALLDTAMPLGKLRGRWHRVRGIATIVTYHPAFLLRYPNFKKDTWNDLQMLMKAMGITPPARKPQ